MIPPVPFSIRITLSLVLMEAALVLRAVALWLSPEIEEEQCH